MRCRHLQLRQLHRLCGIPSRVEFRSGFGRRLDVQQSGRSGYLNLTRNTSLRGVGQRTLARITVEKGESWITQEVPLDLAMGWAGSPTAFSKNIAGSRFNVYHYLHIKALTQLYEFTGLPALEMCAIGGSDIPAKNGPNFPFTVGTESATALSIMAPTLMPQLTSGMRE